MLQSYLTLATRHLRRNGRYFAINVIGLGIALAFCILSYANYRWAYGFDSWHGDKARIFRVEAFKSSNHLLHGVCPALLPPTVGSEIPGIEAATRIDSRGMVIKRGDNVFSQQVHFVDENFLSFFDFPLVAGQPRLADRNAVLISETAAKKFFGTENPIGQSLIFYADLEQRKPLTISGVLKDCPKNSSLAFDFLTHLENQLEGDKPVRYDTWRWMVDAGFVKLKNPADAPAVEAAMQAYVAPQNLANENWQAEKFRLEALPEMALNARDVRWNNLRSGSPPASVWGNLTVAAMLLLTACFNFANTTIAVGNRRLREMGVRKVMGGTVAQLRLQLLSEAGFVCVASLSLGMMLAFPMIDWYNRTWEHLDLKINYLHDFQLTVFLVGTVLFTTLLAGAYPAFYISAFNPASIFRGTLRFGGSSLFSRVMLGLQVAISLAAVVVGFGFARNAQMQRDSDVGYIREGLLGAEASDVASLRQFEEAVRQNPKVQATALTRHHVGFSFRRVEFLFNGQKQETDWLEVGKDYLPMMGMKIVRGADFSAVNAEVGSGTEVLVNETFVREIGGGQTDIIGQMLNLDTVQYRVAGVVKDFVTDSYFDPLRPVVMRCVSADKFRFVVLRAAPEDVNNVHAAMETIWKSLFPYKPFTGFYQSTVLAEAVEVSENIARTMLIFAFVILLMTVSGLFAIVSLNALKQFRSLALRRVLGATPANVAFHLNRNYLIVMVLATIAGCLGGRALALALLDSIFKIHAGVQGMVLVGAAVSVLLVLAATVGVKVWQILRANMAEALKAD